MIAAANQGQLLAHCRVDGTGNLEFTLKGTEQQAVTALQGHLQLLSQSPSSAPQQSLLDLF